MSQFVTRFFTENTGGGCMVDFFDLPDGRVVGLNDECVVLYPSAQAVSEGDASGNFDFPSISRPSLPVAIAAPRLGRYTDSVAEEYTVDLFTLDTNEVLGIDGSTICLYASMADAAGGAPDSVLASVDL